MTGRRSPVRSRSFWPVLTSHSRTVLSSMPEASQRPSGLKAMEYTQLLPSTPNGLSLGKARISRPEVESRKVAVFEEFSVASQCPSRLKVNDWISFISFILPATAFSWSTVATCQNLTVRSQLPEARRCPSGLNAIAVTHPEWAFRVRSSTKSGGEGRVEVTGGGI